MSSSTPCVSPMRAAKTPLAHRALMQVPRRAALQVAALALLPALAPAQSIAPASPAPAEVLREFDSPRLQGSGRMRFLAFDLYEARLWTPAEFRPARYSEAAFALELNYLRSLSTEVLVEASVREMRRLGSLTSQREAIWTPPLKAAFPSVKPGDRITGVHRPGQGAAFYVNGQLRTAWDDPELGRAFFAIWLSPASSEPALRAQLLGAAP